MTDVKTPEIIATDMAPPGVHLNAAESTVQTTLTTPTRPDLRELPWWLARAVVRMEEKIGEASHGRDLTAIRARMRVAMGEADV